MKKLRGRKGSGCRLTRSLACRSTLLLDPEESSAPLDAAPLSVLANRLGRVPALFAPIERATTVVETDVGPVSVPLFTQHSQGWALGLVVGAMFCELGALRRPLPFAGAFVPEVLRHDCDADGRLLRLAITIAHAADDMLGDLQTAGLWRIALTRRSPMPAQLPAPLLCLRLSLGLVGRPGSRLSMLLESPPPAPMAFWPSYWCPA